MFNKLLIYYSFVLVNIMAFIGFLDIESVPQFISAVLFFPMSFYFGMLVLPSSSRALVLPSFKKAKTVQAKALHAKHLTSPRPTSHISPPTSNQGFDIDRRMFLKLIGSAGLALFLFAIFTKKSQAAFFGSAPGGSLTLKDSAGNVVDPAAAGPTDGYKISDIDSSSPAYYGFIDKTSRWFIMKEGTSGDYRYIKGTSGYTTNWTNRASLTYDTFDSVF